MNEIKYFISKRMAENNQGIDEQIVEEVKKLILFDKELTYPERQALEIFYSKVDKGQTVKNSIGPMMKTLNMLSSGSSQKELSSNAKRLFKLCLRYYDIPKKEDFIFYDSGGGSIHRFSWKDLLVMFLILFVGFPIALYIKYLLR